MLRVQLLGYHLISYYLMTIIFKELYLIASYFTSRGGFGIWDRGRSSRVGIQNTEKNPQPPAEIGKFGNVGNFSGVGNSFSGVVNSFSRVVNSFSGIGNSFSVP